MPNDRAEKEKAKKETPARARQSSIDFGPGQRSASTKKWARENENANHLTVGATSLSPLAKPPVSRADGGLQGSTLPLVALTIQYCKD